MSSIRLPGTSNKGIWHRSIDADGDAFPGLLGEEPPSGAHDDGVRSDVLSRVDDGLGRVVALDQTDRSSPGLGSQGRDQRIDDAASALFEVASGFDLSLLVAPGIVVEQRTAFFVIEGGEKGAGHLDDGHHRDRAQVIADEEVAEVGYRVRRQDPGGSDEHMHGPGG